MKTHLTFINRTWKSFRCNYRWLQLSLLLIFISLIVSPVKAQTIEWDKTYGGRSYDFLSVVLPTPDGGSLLAGNSESRIGGNKTAVNKGLTDFWVVKLKADGSKDWDYTYGGKDGEGLAVAQQTPDGGYILGGSSGSGISGDKTEASKGGSDYWIIKINAAGEKEWDKTIGGDDSDELTALRLTPDGGYILGGHSFSGVSGDKTEPNRGGQDPIGSFVGDYWVVKLSAKGNVEWDKTLGGDGSDELSTLLPTPDGGYLVGGSSNSSISGDKTGAQKGGFDTDAGPFDDFWLIKLSAQGNKEWDKTYGGNGYDFLESLEATQDGGYILGGTSTTGSNGDKTEAGRGISDYWILKLNAAGEKEWDKTIGGDFVDHLNSVHELRNGGYLLAGSSRSAKGQDKSEDSKGHFDYWIVQLDATGKKVRDKTIGGDGVDGLNSVAFTLDGNYILGGSSASGKSGDKTEDNKRPESTTGESYDYWVVKVKDDTPPVTATWNMRYGGAGTDHFTDAIKTSDGGYLSAGYTNSGVSGDKTQSSQGQNDYWIVKSDKNGKKVWEKRFGGAGEDYLNRVIQTKDGGYLLAGSSLSGQSGDKTQASQGGRDYWVVKTDQQGNKLWDKVFGGSGSDELKKVVQLPTGEYVLGGYSNSPVSGDKSQASQGGQDYWLVKISSTGTKLWDQRYGGNGDDVLGSFTTTDNNGFVLSGTSLSGKNGDKSQAGPGGSDYWVVRTDKDGNLVWDKTLGGSGADEAYSVVRSGTDYFIAGTSSSGKSGSKSQASQGGQDYWIVKLTSSGTPVWDRTFGGSKDDELRASTFSREGYYVLGGSSASGANGDKSQSSQGSSDYWVVAVDKEGNQVYDQRYGGSGAEELRTITAAQDGGLLLGGRSTSGVSGDKSQPSQGGTDYWLMKVMPSTSPMQAARVASITQAGVAPVNQVQVQAYPNPMSERATIRFNLPETQQATVKVYDNQGRQVATLFNGEAKANQLYEVEWQANQQVAGMYLLQLQTPTVQNTQKILLNK